MPIHPYKSYFPIRQWRSLSQQVLAFSTVSLSVVALLASSGAVMAATPANQTPGDVQVDTQPGQPAPTGSATDNSARFTCQLEKGQYMVMYHPKSQPNQTYPWAVPSDMGGGWTAERRCNEISKRLEMYRPDGLQEMRTGVENGYNVVCVTTQKNPACQIVLTVPPGQDPQTTRDRVFQNLTVADSGQTTEGVNTLVNGSQGEQALNRILGNIGLSSPTGNRTAASRNINLRPFLDPADGGTGSKFSGGVPAKPNPRLNPDGFR